MKKFSKFAILALFLLMFAAAAIACPGNDTLESIAISEAHKPPVVFVLGQDISFGDGVLLAKYKNTTKEIEMSTVEVTGYDKNQLGEQTVTVKYEDKTTTYKVTVVSRLQFIDVETNYFVGETFNKGKGQLKLTYNNGTEKTDFMTAVTVDGFNSSAPVTGQEVTVRYLGFEDKLKVNVYNIDSITLKNHTKNVYKSHETTFATTSDLVVVSGNGGALKKEITLTESMVQDFRPANAGLSNRTEATALNQDVKIKYASGQYIYPIKIVFSDVSVVRLRAKELPAANWNNGLPAISQVDGENATEGLSLYFKLVASEKALITDAEKNILARYVAVYSYDKWVASAEQFSNIFVLNDSGVSFTGESITSVKSNYELLKNPNEPFIVLAEVLKPIYTDFNKLVLFKSGNSEVTAAMHLAKVRNIDPAAIRKIPNMIDFAIDVFETLNVPAVWTNTILKNSYAAAINQVYTKITQSEFRGERSLFGLITKWRELDKGKDDFFDILYSHYLYNEGTGTETNTYIKGLQNIYLPGKLEEVFSNLATAVNYMVWLRDVNTYGVVDSTMVMLGYNNFVRLREEIKTNAMYETLYNILSFSGFSNTSSKSFNSLRSSLLVEDCGYFDICGDLLNDKIFTDFFNQYLEVYKQYIEGETNTLAYGQAVEALMTEYFNMPPVWQFGFNLALNPNYEVTLNAGVNNLNLNYTLNYFATIVKDYYSTKLGDSESLTFTLLEHLLNAVEYYSLYQYLGNADILASFVESMKNAVSAQNTFGSKDTPIFNTYLKGFYDTYKKIYDRFTATNPTIPQLDSTWTTNFVEMYSVMSNYYKILEQIDTGKTDLYGALLSTYAYAQTLVYQVINSDNVAAKWVFYHETSFGSYTLKLGDRSVTFNCFMHYYRNGYSNFLKTQMTAADNSALFTPWSYWTPEFEQFFADAYPVLRRGVFTAPYVAGEEAAVYKLIDEYHSLTLTNRFVFLSIDSGHYFTIGLANFMDQLIPDDELKEVGSKLVLFDLAYVIFAGATRLSSGAVDSLKKQYSDLQVAVRVLFEIEEDGEIPQAAIDDAKDDSINHKELLEWYEDCRDTYNALVALGKLD